MITDKAMIAKLSISQWTARRFDKAVSRQAATAAKASNDAGRFNKLLIPKEALADIARVVNSARAYYYASTLPWDDFGGRILPSVSFMAYSEEMRKFQRMFNHAVDAFTRAYPSVRDAAQARLGAMYCAADYPTVHAIAGKFLFAHYVEPIPSAGDFRVALSESVRRAIKADLDAKLRQRLHAATCDVFRRLADVVEKFRAKTAVPDAVFRDSLLGNVRELVEAIPALNIAEDAELTRVAKNVRRLIADCSVSDLRKDSGVRKRAADDAQRIGDDVERILDKMSGFVRAG